MLGFPSGGRGGGGMDDDGDWSRRNCVSAEKEGIVNTNDRSRVERRS